MAPTVVELMIALKESCTLIRIYVDLLQSETDAAVYESENAIAALRSPVENALSKAVELQSRLAEVLNQRDGGMRMQFHSVNEWLRRLRNLKRQRQ